MGRRKREMRGLGRTGDRTDVLVGSHVGVRVATIVLCNFAWRDDCWKADAYLPLYRVGGSRGPRGERGSIRGRRRARSGLACPIPHLHLNLLQVQSCSHHYLKSDSCSKYAHTSRLFRVSYSRSFCVHPCMCKASPAKKVR